MAKVVPSGVIQLPDFAQLEYNLNRQKRADELEAAKTLSQFKQREGIIAPGAMPVVQEKFDMWQEAARSYAREQSAGNYTALSNAYDNYARAHGAGKYVFDEGKRIRSEYYANPTKYAITSSDLEEQIEDLVDRRYNGFEDLYQSASSIVELPVGMRPNQGSPDATIAQMIEDWDSVKDQYADRNGIISEASRDNWINSYIDSKLSDPSFSKYAAAIQGLDSRIIGVGGNLRSLEEIDNMAPEQQAEFLQQWKSRVANETANRLGLTAFGREARERLNIARGQLAASQARGKGDLPDSVYGVRAPRWDAENQLAIIDIPGVKAVVGDQTVIRAGIDAQGNLKVQVQQKDPKDPEGPVQEKWIDSSDDLWQSIGQSIDTDVKRSGFFNSLTDAAQELVRKNVKAPEAGQYVPEEEAVVDIDVIRETFADDNNAVNRALGVAESNPSAAGDIIRGLVERRGEYGNMIVDAGKAGINIASPSQEDVDWIRKNIKKYQDQYLQKEQKKVAERKTQAEKSKKDQAAGEIYPKLSEDAIKVGDVTGIEKEQGESIAQYVARLQSDIEAARKNLSTPAARRTEEQKNRLAADKKIVDSVTSNRTGDVYRRMIRNYKDYSSISR